jgi:hypothetical protein
LAGKIAAEPAVGIPRCGLDQHLCRISPAARRVSQDINLFNPRPGFAVGNGAAVAPSGNALVLLR